MILPWACGHRCRLWRVRLPMGVRGQGQNDAIERSRHPYPRIGRLTPTVSAARVWRSVMFALAACAAVPVPKSGLPVRTGHRWQGDEFRPSLKYPLGRMKCLIQNLNLENLCVSEKTVEVRKMDPSSPAAAFRVSSRPTPARKKIATAQMSHFLSSLDLSHGNLYGFFVHGMRRIRADPEI